MPIITTSRGRLYADVAGQGETLLLIHGFPLDRRMWQSQIEYFQKRWRVIAPDLKGFGQSEGLDGPVSMGSFAEDTVALLDAIGNCESVTVCGLSMGGYVAWQLIHKWPGRISRLILCHTRAAGDKPETARARRIMAASLRAKRNSQFVDEQLARLVANSTRAGNPQLLQFLRELIESVATETLSEVLLALAGRPDATPWLAEITSPTLVIAGSEDTITPVDEMRDFAVQIPAGEFVEIGGCGHLSPLERPDEFNAHVERFLTFNRR